MQKSLKFPSFFCIRILIKKFSQPQCFMNVQLCYVLTMPKRIDLYSVYSDFFDYAVHSVNVSPFNPLEGVEGTDIKTTKSWKNPTHFIRIP